MRVILKLASRLIQTIGAVLTLASPVVASGATSISNVLNNSSEIPAGYSNSGIAQGSLFKVLGSSLADEGDGVLHDSLAPGGLPVTLNGTSVIVTVNGVARIPALYYATPTQIDGVLPSDSPTGSGTLKVTHNGTSSTFPIEVVTAAPGITTFNGSGVAQHAISAAGALVTYTDAAAPGEVIILWGTGAGPTTDSDTTYTTTPNQTTVPYAIYFGGVPATSVAFAGRSVYPGVSVFGVAIPPNAPAGCSVPVVAVATVNDTTVVSNFVTLPIATGGGVCTDAQTGVTGTQLTALYGKSVVNAGDVEVNQAFDTFGKANNNVTASFQQWQGSSYHLFGAYTMGSCVIGQFTSYVQPVGLSVGTITVTDPGGSPVTLIQPSQNVGLYQDTLASIPSTGGAFVFSGSGGTSGIGAFTATAIFPSPLLSWTNRSSATTIDRNQGLTVDWTGGAPGSYVSIGGSVNTGILIASYTCYAPQAAGQFTVPSYILRALPAGKGVATISNYGTFTPFSAIGLDFGGALGSVSFSAGSTYN
jgi:uncharacterized protein (TIGR03437 family)